MPAARLKDFGLPKMDFVKGSMGVNATFVSSDKEDKADAALDITHTSISLPEHGFIKKEGEKATLKLTAENLPSGNTLIKSFKIKSDSYDIQGAAEYDKVAADFSSFSFSPLKAGGHDLDALSYERNGNNIKLTAKGRSFDATPYLADNSNRNRDLSYVIGLHTDRLILGAGREASEVSLEADCPAAACKTVALDLKLKDGSPFHYKISDGLLSARCDNAGELARTMAVFDSMEGGKMTLKGKYNGVNLEGGMEIREYKLRNAPVVTKMFTIASLTGFLNTLTGNGIYFDRLSAPFIYHDGLLILKEAKAHGAAMGMTADGNIDLNKSTLDLTGVLVPSYTLNSLIGNLPLIGDLLQGGEGKGLVALSYGIHGNMKDPAVHMNPLSVLTPGFLRDIF